MEKRKEARFQTDGPALITILGSPDAAPIPCMVVDISGNGMRLRAPEAIAFGTPVKVELRDMLALGEVVRCEPDGEGCLIALSLHHALHHLDSLEKLNRSLLGERTEEQSEAPTRHNEKK